MLDLDRSLVERLKRMKVLIDVPDENTVILRNVPPHRQYFNKRRVNLLVKRAAQGAPFVACVDGDLKYTGPDAALNQVLTGGPTCDGWRVLMLGCGLSPRLQESVDAALAVIGFDGEEPALTAGAESGWSAGGSLLENFGVDLTDLVGRGEGEPTAGREIEVDEVATCINRWSQARLVVIWGPSGVGKTNLLYALARRLASTERGAKLVSVDLARVFAGSLVESERENLLVGILSEAHSKGDTVLALDHIERACFGESGTGILLLSSFLDAGLHIVGTMLPEHRSKLQRAPLARRLYLAELKEPSWDATVEILAALRPRIASHHGVEIDESCLRAAVGLADRLPGALPAKAIQIIDAAAARAALADTSVVGPDDVCFAASRYRPGP